MRDISPTSSPTSSPSSTDLEARLHDAIARRLDAETAAEHARAGHDLLELLDEMRRQGVGPPGQARPQRPAARDGQSR